MSSTRTSEGMQKANQTDRWSQQELLKLWKHAKSKEDRLMISTRTSEGMQKAKRTDRWSWQELMNRPMISMRSLRSSGSPPVSLILVMPCSTNSCDRVRISEVVNRCALGLSSTPSSGIQYWPGNNKHQWPWARISEMVSSLELRSTPSISIQI